MSKADDKMTAVKTAMLLHTPFFASIMLDMMEIKVGKFPHVFPPGMETAATNGKKVWVDEDFLLKMKLPEVVFVMCHEIGHAMWQHMARSKLYQDRGFEGKKFDHGRWNRAGDYVINDMLVGAKIGKMPDFGLHQPDDYDATMLVDDVYRKLRDDPNDGPGQGPGEGGTLDQHVVPNSADGTTDAEWKRVIKTAANAAKAQGKLPANLERYVEELLNPKVPWAEKLRYHFNRVAGRDATTWTRPHRRRLIQQGIIMPSYSGFSAGHIVFVCDTSGSMSDKELAQGLGECDSILHDCTPEAVTLIGCDADVHDVFEFYAGDSLAANPPPIKGGGGTSFVPPFKWVEEKGIRPATLIYFTDMFGTFPDDPGYPVIWCATTEGKEAPFGTTIYVEMNEE